MSPLSLFLHFFHVSQAYEEVKIFFSSSVPTVSFSDVVKSLDTKLQAVEALLSFVKELSMGRLEMNHPSVFLNDSHAEN